MNKEVHLPTITRRDFVVGAAATGVVAAFGLTGCAAETNVADENKDTTSIRTIFINGKVYTANGTDQATAFVIEEGIFTYVGDDNTAQTYAQEQDVVHDLEGARVIPGMVDTHSHYLALSGINLETIIEINQNDAHEEVLAQVKEIADSISSEAAPIIFGVGYGLECITLATELDKAVNDRPACLVDSGGHSGWINSKMIEMLGLTKDTPDPKPGVSYYARDDEGNPSGQVVESPALTPILNKAGFAKTETLIQQLPGMISTMHSFGYVAAYDAGLMLLDERETYEALKDFDSTVQFYTSHTYNGRVDQDEYLAQMIEIRESCSNNFLHPTTLKLFKDGTLEAQTAWMFEDYLPPASGNGGEVLSHDLMLGMASKAAAENFNIHVHAIGDKAISDTLTFYRDLGDIEGTKTMAHVQILPEDGVELFSQQTDVFYQTTPVWLIDDDFTKTVLGEERHLRQMPLQSLHENGITLTFGSDAPVSGGLEGVNPFNNMQCAVNRAFDEVTYIAPKSEGIDIATCIDAYTINAAHQLGAEDDFGSISEGKKAHFVVLSQDLLEVDPSELSKTTVVQTWVQGECVYDAALQGTDSAL